MSLVPDCLVIDDRRVLHGRTSYEDHADPARRRCLVRVMLRQHPSGHTA
ncbi:TauD/TfdA family dioxygenase [Streptomyces sp. NBC_01443]|nr:TauD/TfdA family dioxygenase [Streptomyces sp. NBC_01443]MCX4631903.1 TauD/TfdA family dioxygenase [Streptomyces sp. NBC_01443]